MKMLMTHSVKLIYFRQRWGLLGIIPRLCASQYSRFDCFSRQFDKEMDGQEEQRRPSPKKRMQKNKARKRKERPKVGKEQEHA